MMVNIAIFLSCNTSSTTFLINHGTTRYPIAATIIQKTPNASRILYGPIKANSCLYRFIYASFIATDAMTSATRCTAPGAPKSTFT